MPQNMLSNKYKKYNNFCTGVTSASVLFGCRVEGLLLSGRHLVVSIVGGQPIFLKQDTEIFDTVNLGKHISIYFKNRLKTVVLRNIVIDNFFLD